ncbi:MAG: FAD-dependent oxidoreductase [Anaerolineae bacterium]|nr:FAD-dependent oxidoreductase [Anaerolineae bacterium]MDW8099095.1 FAD-dependent oxidoreductase [Anaerolineae bacterium]
MPERRADILIVGGGTGGCAAAIAAASLGYRVVMTEVTDWIGGQLTAQAVPPDEHPWIEQFGCTRRYRQFRNGVRQFYRDHYPLLPEARAHPELNPGAGYVSRICHEPRVALAVLEQMMAPHRAAGRLDVLLERKPVAADTQGDRVRSVTVRNLRTGEDEVISAPYILDATELGDLLPLAGVEYVTGAESQAETGEPHAVSGPAQPNNVQAITWCFPMAYDPHGDHTIERPAQYERWRDYVPRLRPAWPDKLLSWTHPDPITLQPRQRVLFPEESDDLRDALWLYRRIVTRQHYPEGAMPHEVTLVNWPQNDYWEGNIIDQPEDEVARCLEEARQLSLSLLYWLQTEAPRPDGGQGYPGLYLRPDLVGTGDGLAKFPYIRESRRIRAVFTVTENHVGTEARGGREAETFRDSVGVGCYRIDLHPSTGGDNYIDISSLPFQIPLGALIPIRVDNLLPACKNLGVTHITNGCYRLHPVEWNIGEAAGLLAAFALSRGVPPRAVREKHELLADFQRLLELQGIELIWPRIHPV